MPVANHKSRKNIDELAIEQRPIDTLVPYARNARTHSHKQIRKLQRSLTEFGWTNPLIIDDANNLICGHGRLEAARRNGETSVPVMSLGQMSEADRRAYIIADNKLAEEATWSKELLRSELSGLVELGYEVELTGFDTFEIDGLLCFGDDDAGPGSEEAVELPTADARAVTRVGDLWVIGQHRLIVGDARDPAVYDRLLDGEQAQMIITDPPYGCAIQNNVSGNPERMFKGIATYLAVQIQLRPCPPVRESVDVGAIGLLQLYLSRHPV